MVLLFFCFFGWFEKKDQEFNLYNFRPKINEKINFEKWTSEKTNIRMSDGITFLGDYLYITDKEANTIVVLDKEGNFQNSSLKSDLFLIEPSVLKTDGKFLYVIDSGNNQLKIVSQDFKLIKSINLPVLEPWSSYQDLEIIDNEMYLSTNAPKKEEAAIYRIDNYDNKIYKFSERFIGYLSNFKNELMAVNSLEYFERKNEKGMKQVGGESGKNSLFKVIDDELETEFAFMDKYAPLDFLLIDDYIYVVSSALANLDKYTIDGQYVETILDLEYIGNYTHIESMNNSILVICQSEKAIYKIDLD
jgi:hypothetical protein